MEKSFALLLSLVLCGAVYANTASAQVSLGGNTNQHVKKSLDISLDPLFPNKPYKITCTITNLGYPNAVEKGVVYPIVPGIKTTYAINGKQFVGITDLTSLTNTFIANNIENSAPINSSLTLINLDDKFDVEISKFDATPIQRAA